VIDSQAVRDVVEEDRILTMYDYCGVMLMKEMDVDMKDLRLWYTQSRYRLGIRFMGQ